MAKTRRAGVGKMKRGLRSETYLSCFSYYFTLILYVSDFVYFAIAYVVELLGLEFFLLVFTF